MSYQRSRPPPGPHRPLQLNHQRYVEEVWLGLHEKKKNQREAAKEAKGQRRKKR